MSDSTLYEQGEAIVTLMPRLLRRLFVLTPDDPAMEIPGAQMRVCNILRDGPRTMSGISSELSISQSATTQIADRLEKAGMVERLQPEDDRRCKQLALTSHGVEVMEDRKKRRVQGTVKVLQLLSPQQRIDVVKTLSTLLEASIKAYASVPNGVHALESEHLDC